MIDLKRKRDVEPIAQEWRGWVKTFFTALHTRGFQPSLGTGEREIKFVTYAGKLQYQCRNAAIKYAAGDSKKYRYCMLFLNKLWRDFDIIILAKPTQMNAMITKWNSRYPMVMEFIAELSDVLTLYYDAVAKRYGNKLIDRLKIKTCPYCNRQFIHSFKGVHTERPELDHFLPKKENPIFCLSFYNLIPACHGCNHEKLEDKLRVNPHVRAFSTSFMITDKDGNKLTKSKIYHLTEKEIRLKFDNPNADEQQNIKVLGLVDVYNKHTDYVKSIIEKSMAYDAHARKALVESFQGVGYHPRQVYDFVWGRYLNDAEYEDRPLSKLTKDILDQLDIHR
jgi:5-methylcytosine-specific restriction endonuclease McrA